MNVSSDATPSYKGYRRQALYTLVRVLDPDSSTSLIFQPEGQEDLAILDDKGDLLEVIQVKSYTDPLTLSSFDPEKGDSFFHRIARLLENHPNAKITIASYGEVGPELSKAISGDSTARKNVGKKLSEHEDKLIASKQLAQKLLTRARAENLVSGIQLVGVSELDLTTLAYDLLSATMASIDIDFAFAHLIYWLYICAETKRKVNRADLLAQLTEVGKFLADRSSHYAEWFTSIVPINSSNSVPETQSQLAEDFYQGVSARYEHILADLDVRRPAKIQEIQDKFRESRIVIVHGASGQGKSALAYRYLHEYFPPEWRFQVQLVESRRHALSIARALAGYADALKIPIAVYLDVLPGDEGWTELIKQLGQHSSIHVLVTVREEDFRRATISRADVSFTTIDLAFESNEAREIYRSLTTWHLPTQFLDFEDAWNRFGGTGPLMEFVYLVTQGTMLRERLAQQIHRLEEEADGSSAAKRGGLNTSGLELLRLVSVASAFGARLEVKSLATALGVPVPQRTLRLLEEEYLVRRSGDGVLVEGLHPIRSTIIVDLLIDPTFSPWVESARRCLDFMYAPDVGIFLLHAFSRRRPEIRPLLQTLDVYQPARWIAIAGVGRALVWLGVREYIDTNQTLIAEASEDLAGGWRILLDNDLTDAVPGAGESLRQLVLDSAAPERKEWIASFAKRQSDKQQVFARARTWLARRTQRPLPPQTDDDWAGLAETLFWLARWDIDWPLADWLSPESLQHVIEDLPIEILADLVLGLHDGYSQLFESWYSTNHKQLIARFREETETVVLEDDGHLVRTHYLIGLNQSTTPAGKGDGFHDQTMTRIWLLRRLFPERDSYGAQGYGHQLLTTPLPYDSTYKAGIPQRSLPPAWMTTVNKIFGGLIEQQLRPASWQDYTQAILILRQTVVETLRSLIDSLEYYFSSPKYANALTIRIDSPEWTHYKNLLNHSPLLPQCVLDEWGFTNGSDLQIGSENSPTPLDTKRSLVSQKYSNFLRAMSDYTSDLSAFNAQVFDTVILNTALGRLAHSAQARNKVLEQFRNQGNNPDMPRLSIGSLTRLAKNLPRFQVEFRQLLEQFSSNEQLVDLEQQEQVTLMTLWNIWYFFAMHPNKVILNAKQKCSSDITELRRKIRAKLQRVLDTCSTDDIKIRIVSEDLQWDYTPTLWVTVDGADEVAVYNLIEQIITNIRNELTKDVKLIGYLVDLYWPFIVLIPLLHGKSLHGQAWRINLPARLLDIELSIWSLQLQSIPIESLSKLGIAVWSDPELDIAANLLGSSNLLSLATVHVRDLAKLHELDDQGATQILQHIEELKLSEIYQAALDAATETNRAIEGLTAAEVAQRPYLLPAIQSAIELSNSLILVQDQPSHIEISLGAIAEWADRLEQSRIHALLAYLYKANDIVSRLESIKE